MSVDVFNFLSSNDGQFNCFERAIITDQFIVRPASYSELAEMQFESSDCNKSQKLLLVVGRLGLSSTAGCCAVCPAVARAHHRKDHAAGWFPGLRKQTSSVPNPCREN